MEIPNKEETIKKEGGLVKESTESKFTNVKVSDFSSFISKLNWK
jgi:DNA polymerase elongation subunit (family B)